MLHVSIHLAAVLLAFFLGLGVRRPRGYQPKAPKAPAGAPVKPPPASGAIRIPPPPPLPTARDPRIVLVRADFDRAIGDLEHALERVEQVHSLLRTLAGTK